MAQLANLTTTLAIESASFVNGIEQSRGAVRRLVASLDPAAAAQAKFNRQMDLAERGLKSGQLSADLYGRVVDRLKQQLDNATSGGGRLVQASGSMRAGFQQLGYQLGDISQGFAVGTSAATIFAQQSGQVIQALQLMTTETTGFLGVLGNPWVQIAAAAVVAITPLVSKIFEGNDALGEQVKKLQDNADKQGIAEQANRIFAGTQAGLEQRIAETTKALNQQNASLRTNAELQNVNARAEYAAAQKTLSDSRAALKAAQDQLKAARGGLAAADPRTAVGAGMDPDTLRASVQDAAAAVMKAQADVQSSSIALNNSRVFLAAEQAVSESTLTGKITKEYDDRIRAVERAAVADAQAGKQVGAATKQRIAALEQEKQAALKSAQAQTGASANLADAQGRLAAATNGVERASAQLAVTRAQARAELKAGTITQAEYTAKIRDAQGAVDAARASAKAHTAAVRAEAKATADAIKLINDASAEAYKAVSGIVADRSKSFLKGFSVDAGQWDKIAKQADTAFKAQEDMQLKNEEDLRRKRMQDERDIAGLYQDLFTGGTKRIWQDFEQIGFSVISQLMAKWTVGAALGKSGTGSDGLFGSLANALGLNLGQNNAAISSWLGGGSSAGLGFGGPKVSIPGFANGGSFQFRGKSGIDQNVLSLNGSPIARVSKGETATISNGRASNDNASSIHVTVNAEGAVLTDTVKTWVAVGVASGLQEHDRQKAKKAGRSFR